MKKTAEIDITVADKGGNKHHITTGTLKAAPDRTRDYLKAAEEWTSEFTRELAPLCGGTEAEEEKYEAEFNRRHQRIIEKFHLPKGVWFPAGEEFKAEVANATVPNAINAWATGTLDDFESLLEALDQGFDIDQGYILFGIPIKRLGEQNLRRLYTLAKEFGARNLAAAAQRN